MFCCFVTKAMYSECKISPSIYLLFTDSESCSSGEEDLSDTESVFSRLEHNREELERELGFEKFLQVYRYVQVH